MIDRVLIEKGAEPYKMTGRIVAKLRDRLARQAEESAGPDKRTLRLLSFPGEFPNHARARNPIYAVDTVF
jgi:hypothetical protein